MSRLLRPLFLAACALLLVQETALGSILVGFECEESCPDDVTDGRCAPTCLTCACVAHAEARVVVTPVPVRTLEPAVTIEPRPKLSPLDAPPADVFHVPRLRA